MDMLYELVNTYEHPDRPTYLPIYCQIILYFKGKTSYCYKGR